MLRFEVIAVCFVVSRCSYVFTKFLNTFVSGKCIEYHVRNCMFCDGILSCERLSYVLISMCGLIVRICRLVVPTPRSILHFRDPFYIQMKFVVPYLDSVCYFSM